MQQIEVYDGVNNGAYFLVFYINSSGTVSTVYGDSVSTPLASGSYSGGNFTITAKTSVHVYKLTISKSTTEHDLSSGGSLTENRNKGPLFVIVKN